MAFFKMDEISFYSWTVSIFLDTDFGFPRDVFRFWFPFSFSITEMDFFLMKHSRSFFEI